MVQINQWFDVNNQENIQVSPLPVPPVTNMLPLTVNGSIWTNEGNAGRRSFLRVANMKNLQSRIFVLIFRVVNDI